MITIEFLFCKESTFHIFHKLHQKLNSIEIIKIIKILMSRDLHVILLFRYEHGIISLGIPSLFLSVGFLSYT